jgi:DNA-binding NtrC family response regulator
MSEVRHNVVEDDNVTHGDADDSGQCTIGWEPVRGNTHSLGSSGSGMVFALSETPSGRFRRDGVPGRQDVQLGRELLTQGWMNGVEPALTQVADTNATVVIRGEAGVGKGLVATLIHSTSPRCERPFVTVSCASRSPEGLESELFGHEKGAVPWALRRKPGRFEFANTGTIFVRQVEALPGTAQARFLRALEHSEVQRLGGHGNIPVDVRIIASYTTNPGTASGPTVLREALSRLDAVELSIPPLRERRPQIPALAAVLLARFNREYRRRTVLYPETVRLLTEYSWPGNLRELTEVIRRFVIIDDPRRNHEEFQSSRLAI